ncbi:response regulator transcription factor [Halopenitus persicus]|uniref:DNA-binding response regulator, OmpR family, contains REC and winged-helix (WHTH) domain n=1 Tax=Halopenitus persicus TaxID=1048396 RepID=A0A1H3NT24_9EURY|nr:response regulator [Halopenitus persicus]SDY92042.1 DNA-binding response regulator, OmpR family, contains REC and winged-helix (wHTH) domain [Halopenitus persicus]
MSNTDIPSETNGESASVLIVEDERQLADLYATWLTETYDVETAYDGEEALTKLDDSVDVVLLDRRMPSIDGDEVLETMQEQGLDCRVVMVSAVTPDFDVIEMGFDDYLTKPVDGDDLHHTVERMLTRTDYDQIVQEFYQLTSKRAVLKSEKADAELRASDEYDELLDRITVVQNQLEETATEFDDMEFEAVFRTFDSESYDRPSDIDNRSEDQ